MSVTLNEVPKVELPQSTNKPKFAVAKKAQDVKVEAAASEAVASASHAHDPHRSSSARSASLRGPSAPEELDDPYGERLDEIIKEVKNLRGDIETQKKQISEKAIEDAKAICNELLVIVEGRMNDPYMDKGLIEWQPVHAEMLNKQKDKLEKVEKTLLENGIRNFPEEVKTARKEFVRIMGRHRSYDAQRNIRLLEKLSYELQDLSSSMDRVSGTTRSDIDQHAKALLIKQSDLKNIESYLDKEEPKKPQKFEELQQLLKNLETKQQENERQRTALNQHFNHNMSFATFHQRVGLGGMALGAAAVAGSVLFPPLAPAGYFTLKLGIAGSLTGTLVGNVHQARKK